MRVVNKNMHDAEAILRDDQYLTSLAEGFDPTNGEDPVMADLLALREDVYAPIPDRSNVVSISAWRSHFNAALVGAAAAAVVIVGAGGFVFNATPGSPLWGMNKALFGEHASVVELASTLEQAQTLNEQGDTAGAKDLIEQAKSMVAALERSELAVPEAQITTVTETLVEPAPATSATVAGEPAAPSRPADVSAATVTKTITNAPVLSPTAEPTTGFYIDPALPPLPAPSVEESTQSEDSAEPPQDEATAPVSEDTVSAQPIEAAQPTVAEPPTMG
ncbi:MAG: hypothetical protein SPI77_07655 [Corynebacterium sp.]|nr:hypothetical protein [Corynebacterium sp.]